MNLNVFRRISNLLVLFQSGRLFLNVHDEDINKIFGETNTFFNWHNLGFAQLLPDISQRSVYHGESVGDSPAGESFLGHELTSPYSNFKNKK